MRSNGGALVELVVATLIVTQLMLAVAWIVATADDAIRRIVSTP